MKELEITDLDSLKRAQDRLRIIIDNKEKDLTASFSYFKTNYKSILWSYINPLKGENGLANIASLFAEGAIGAQAGIVPMLLSGPLRRLLVRSGINLFKKILPKKKKDTEETKSP